MARVPDAQLLPANTRNDKFKHEGKNNECSNHFCFGVGKSEGEAKGEAGLEKAMDEYLETGGFLDAGLGEQANYN